MSELIANIASAFNNTTSPNQETSIPQPASPDNLSPSSPVLAIPLPRYTTEPILPRPDFNAPGSDDSQQTSVLNNAFIEDSVDNPDLLPFSPDSDSESLVSTNTRQSTDDAQEPQTPPPLRPQTPPVPLCRLRFLPFLSLDS